MSFAFLPLYTGDYLRDTRHLSPLRHGIYLLLLMHCWDQKGPLPHDEQECAGIANCRSADEINALRYVLERFFVLMDDGWYNKRMQAEVERSETISNARSAAGKKGYQAKAKQLLSKSQASATTPTPTPILSPSPSPQENTLSGKPDDAHELLAFLNKVSGKNFRPVDANMKLIKARLHEYELSELKAMVAAKASVWKYDGQWNMYLRPATLFNATKCAQYIAEVDDEN